MKGGKRHDLTGQIIQKHSQAEVAGVTVEAWDDDRFVARTKTDAHGLFRICIGDHYLRALFDKREPRLHVKLSHRGQKIHEGKTWKPGAQPLEFEVEADIAGAEPHLSGLTADWEPGRKLKVKTAPHPLPKGTLGTIGRPVEVSGSQKEFPETLLRLPYSDGLARGIDPATARLFRWDDEVKTLRPVWNSGVNPGLGFCWGKIRRTGVYVVIGLPSDKLLSDALGQMAYRRRCNDLDTPAERSAITKAVLGPFLEAPTAAMEQLHQLVAKLETNSSIAVSEKDVRRGRAGFVEGMDLPERESAAAFKKRLRALETPPGGFAEEQLFYPPEIANSDQALEGVAAARIKGDVLRRIETLEIWKYVDLHLWWPWLFSQDWWMYQANERHSGHAMGASDIRSTNVSRMVRLTPTPVSGPVYTKPAIVDGKIYVGTIETGLNGGTLYKIDLKTGNIEGKFETPMLPATYSIRGVGGSPAVVDGFVYFTSIHGRVYCLDISTMTTATPPPAPVWVTDLKNQDLAHNQPVSNGEADCWSGPLVVKGNVYVGCGEGETADACGFVYCLDAASGRVKWLFCTNQFRNGVDNQPNVVPRSLIPPPGVLPPGFTAQADPPVRGGSVWSSLAYCQALDRVYVGTGNPSPDSPAPNARYSSGCIALDATTGRFKGMWSPGPLESYWPGDNDIDVPGGPMVYSEGGQWRVAIGSKSGAFVILDAKTMNKIASRQILPRRNGDGTPGNPGTSLPSVVPPPPPGGSENHYGVYGTPARGGNRLFVSMGSDDGIPDVPDGLGDPHKTPFLRVMDDTLLTDAWPVVTDGFGITRYANPDPPMYTSSETGVGSAAVVNDVVFACTGGFGVPVSIYAFDSNTGLPLWQDHAPVNDFCLGAAIYGNYVVIGAGATVRRYVLRVIRIPWPWIFQLATIPQGPRSISIPASVVNGGGPIIQEQGVQ